MTSGATFVRCHVIRHRTGKCRPSIVVRAVGLHYELTGDIANFARGTFIHSFIHSFINVFNAERLFCYFSVYLTTCALSLSLPIPSRLYTLPYWSNPPFLIFDIRVLWRSGMSARAPELQKLKMVG